MFIEIEWEIISTSYTDFPSLMKPFIYNYDYCCCTKCCLCFVNVTVLLFFYSSGDDKSNGITCCIWKQVSTSDFAQPRLVKSTTTFLFFYTSWKITPTNSCLTDKISFRVHWKLESGVNKRQEVFFLLQLEGKSERSKLCRPSCCLWLTCKNQTAIVRLLDLRWTK